MLVDSFRSLLGPVTKPIYQTRDANIEDFVANTKHSPIRDADYDHGMQN